MDKVLHYLYDPLCGWCYGATPAVSKLLGILGVTIELLPTGLFSGEGARPMDDTFAAYAWSNDQRIERLTGQRFTERYRYRILGNHQQLFDSGPASVALTAVALTVPAREFEVLKAIQHARYVVGSDITSLPMLIELLEGRGFKEAAAMIARSDESLLNAHRGRMSRAQALMQEFGVRGVPTFIAEAGAKRWMLEPSAIYSTPHALISQLKAA